MFGQSSFGGFGQSQPAFGSTPASSPFGGSTAFGAQQPSPFGATPGTGVFGASQPAFGASTTPAFGAPPAQGGMFGSTGFGAKPATGSFAFGGSTTPSPFGAPSQPAFGAAASTPAFGGFGASSTPAFGASSTPAFGASSTPAFGGFGAATSTPAFGAPAAAPAFGSSPGAPSPFGAAPAAGGFGAPAAAQQQNMGSRVAPYQKHQDKDTSSSSSTAPTTVYYSSITAMPQYAGKSVEELRWEDYQAGVKNASSAPAPAAAPGGFGAPAAATPGGFGFGSSSPAFGASSASPFGASSTPAFGASSASPFGAGGFGSSTPASTPAFGGFGASSSPATGTGLFGAATSQPAASSGFSFGGSSTPAFGAPSSTATFGAASTPSMFGGSAFGASSGGGLFGAASTPAFGASSAASPFGGTSTPAFGTPSSSPFGASPAAGTTGFGAPASTGFSFGTPGSTASKPATGFSFGGQTASSGGLFGAPASTGSLFGASSTPAFGSTGGLFGSTPSSNPAGGSSLFGGTSTFGAAPATGGGLFGAPQNPAQGSTPGLSGFSFGPAAAPNPAAAAPVAPATVNQQPYGALQPLPQVNVPEHKVGITQRPVRAAVTGMRPSPLLTLRTSTPRFGLGIPAAGGYSRPSSSSGGSPFNLNTSPAAADNTTAAGGRSGSPAAALLLPVRDNPHRLFIRSPPPATTPASNGSSLSPAVGRAAAAGDDSTPVKTPGTRRTPYQTEAPVSNGTAAAAADDETPHRSNGGGGPSAAAVAGSSSDRRDSAGGAKAAPSHIADTPRLGKLAAEGYSIEPSERELHNLARQNPSALSRVSGFKVKRAGYGSLHWLVPVDIRGADLEQVIQIERGEVSLYMNADGTASESKPSEGSGLNCPCRVTLTGVYKKSKQAPENAAAMAAAFRKRLQKYCVDMGAKFVDYQADGGVWIFEVEHFSRYGLPSDDSDEELGGSEGTGDYADAKQQQPAGGSQQSQEPEYTFGGAPSNNEDSDADMANDVTQQTPNSSRRQVRFSEADMMDAADEQGSEEEAEDEGLEADGDKDLAVEQQHQEQQQISGLGSVPLQHALPALLGQTAEQLMDLRGGFFSQGGTGAAAVGGVAPVSPMQIEQDGGRISGGYSLTRQWLQQQHWGAAPEHNWVRPKLALLQRQQRGQQQRQTSPAQQQLVLHGADAGASQSQLARVEASSAAAAAAPTAAAMDSGAAGALVVPPLTARVLQSYKRRQQSAGPPSIGSAAVAAFKIGRLLPASVAVSNSNLVVDASLMLGRSFRVSWGPNGMLAVPQNPAMVSGKTPTAPAAATTGASVANPLTPAVTQPNESGLPFVELRMLQPVAAVAGSSIDAAALHNAAAAAALQQRVVSGLDLLLQYSSAGQQQQAAAANNDDQMQDGSTAAAAAPAAQWHLKLNRKQLSGFIREQEDTIVQAAKVAARAADNNSSSNSISSSTAAATGCGQHLQDLWLLVRVLFEYVDGEDDAGVDDTSAANAHSPAAAAAQSSSENGHSSADEASSEGLGVQSGFGLGVYNKGRGAGSSRTQLAAFQRKAAFSHWLQRKLRPEVTAAVQALQNSQQQQDAVLWSLLHFMSGRQVAAAVAVAVAVGDVRLATLLAAVGQAAAAGGGVSMVQQLQAWARAGLLPGHVSTPRKLLLALLAVSAASSGVGGMDGLLEVSTALQLHWSRTFGLWLWYGVSWTEPIAAVTRAFTAALATAPQLPRPVPPHSRQQQQQHKTAPADTQYALLQLHALGVHGLGVGLLNSYPDAEDKQGDMGLTVGGLVAQLLRVQGHSSNPLDYSTAWQLLMVLQSIGALSGSREQYEHVTVAIAGSLISQLLLLGPAAVCWAPFVALHIPDTLLLPGSRAAALQQLLQVTAPQWCDDPSLVGWLRSTLQLPLPWLHDAQALWFGYCRRYSLQLLHLIAAGNWHAAHDLTCRKVAPLLAVAATGSAAVADAAVADFTVAAGALLEAVGEDAAAEAAATTDGGANSMWWCEAAALQEEPAAAVAAAAYIAATTASGQSSSGATAAAVALRALCRILGVVRGTLGSSWQLGAGVYSAWCGVFLDPAGNTHDPAAVAAAGGDAAAGEVVERCLHLSDLLSDVAAAAAADGNVGNGGSAWWGLPMQRLVQCRMTADVGKALVRLGVGTNSSQQQQAPLLVPLAALGASAVTGTQPASQMLAGAAANIAGSVCTVTYV